MIKKQKPVKPAGGFAPGVPSEAFEKTGQLEEALINLGYEGKPSRGKNLKKTRELVKFLTGALRIHEEVEEKVIFPFLKTYLPKLEAVIHLLEAEHEDFKKHLGEFRAQVKGLGNGKSPVRREKAVAQIRQTGIYLVYFLRHHLRAGHESIYKVIERDLRADEKRRLAGQVAKRLKSLSGNRKKVF